MVIGVIFSVVVGNITDIFSQVAGNSFDVCTHNDITSGPNFNDLSIPKD